MSNHTANSSWEATTVKATAAALLGILLTLTACSARDPFDPESGLRIAVEDPDKRLGSAPWTIAVFNPYLGPEEKHAVWAQGTAAPGKAYVVLRRRDEDVWRILDFMTRDELDFGLVLPTLRRDGYWLARLKHGTPSGDTAGTARFCQWGSIVPVDGAESLGLQSRPVKKEYGFEYEVTVRIPGASVPR
jgi:hypothetical protein